MKEQEKKTIFDTKKNDLYEEYARMGVQLIQSYGQARIPASVDERPVSRSQTNGLQTNVDRRPLSLTTFDV